MPNRLDYELSYLPLKNLSVIWVKAQRLINQKWVDQIAAEFDPDKFEPIIVTKPNSAGEYHIVEGQHRKAAIEKWLGGDASQKVPCRVIDHGDPAKAAEIWLGINKGRKPVRPTVEFLIAVEAEREVEVAINNIVKRRGYVVVNGGKQADTIVAVGALRRVYAISERILDGTLQACRLLWGSDPQGVGAVLLQGVGIFLNEFLPHVEPAHLKKAVLTRYKSPHQLISAAKIRQQDYTNESLHVAVSEVLRLAYNRGQRAEKKLLHKESDD